MTDHSSCPSIQLWDQFLLGVENEQTPALTGHLSNCQMCQVTMAWRRELLTDLQAAIIEAEKQKSVISDFHPVFEVPVLTPRVSAAQTESYTLASDSSINLVSSDETLLIKGVRDASTGEVWLYVIAEDPRYFRSVLVRPFGDTREFLTDENGRINLGPIPLAALNSGRVEVVLSQAVFLFSPFEQSLAPLLESTLQSEAGDSIKVSLTDIGTARQVKIDILKLSRRVADRSLRIAIRDPRTGKARIVTPSESFADSTFGRESIELYLFQ